MREVYRVHHSAHNATLRKDKLSSNLPYFSFPSLDLKRSRLNLNRSPTIGFRPSSKVPSRFHNRAAQVPTNTARIRSHRLQPAQQPAAAAHAAMSAEYRGQEPLDIARQAERDLNSHAAKQGLNNASDSG